MAAPANHYRDPANVLAAKHAAERSCRVCIYNARRGPETPQGHCLHPRAAANYPRRGQHCPGFKHREE